MSYQRWTLMNKNSSKADQQIAELQRLLQSNDDMDDDELIPMNRSRLVQLGSIDSDIDEESEDIYEEEEEAISGEDENDLLLRLLLEKHKQSLRNSGKLKRASVSAKRRRVYDDLREKLNDIRDQQDDIIDISYNRNRGVSRYADQKVSSRFPMQRANNNNRFTEQRGRPRRFMEQKSQRNFNDQRGNNRFFEKRGNRRFSDQRGRQRRFNDQRGGRNRFNGQGRKSWSKPEKNYSYACEEVEENDKDEDNEEMGKIDQNEELPEQKVTENQDIDDEAEQGNEMETQPSEMEALMGFSGFQSTKQT